MNHVGRCRQPPHGRKVTRRLGARVCGAEVGRGGRNTRETNRSPTGDGQHNAGAKSGMATMHAVVAVRDPRAMRRGALIHVYPRCSLPVAAHRNDARTANEARSTGSRASLVPVERAHDERVANLVKIAANPFAGTACRREAGIWAEIVESAARLRGADVARNALQPTRHRNVDERPQSAVDKQQ